MTRKLFESPSVDFEQFFFVFERCAKDGVLYPRTSNYGRISVIAYVSIYETWKMLNTIYVYAISNIFQSNVTVKALGIFLLVYVLQHKVMSIALDLF